MNNELLLTLNYETPSFILQVSDRSERIEKFKDKSHRRKLLRSEIA